MTTIRERSTAALAEALYDEAGDIIRDPAAILDASPTLAADIDFAIAFREAKAALPEGWFLKSVTNWPDDPQWMAQAMATGGRSLDDFRHGTGPTPTDALVALTEALRERAR